MVLRRSKYEIVSEILKIANTQEGINVTKIVYSVNLNFKNAQETISELIRCGFLERVEGEGDKFRYRTTRKGLEYVRKYEELESVKHF